MSYQIDIIFPLALKSFLFFIFKMMKSFENSCMSIAGATFNETANFGSNEKFQYSNTHRV